MAIAFNNAADLGNSGGPANTFTASYTLGSGSNILWVCVLGDTLTDVISGVTYAGSSMTLVNKQQIATGARWTYLFFLVNPTSGANNVVVTASGGGANFILAGAIDYTGAATSSQPDNSALGGVSTPTNTATTSITPSASNTWAIMVASGFDVAGAGGAPTAGAGSTRRTFDGVFGGWGLFDSNGTITAGSPYSMTSGYGGNSGTGIAQNLATMLSAAAADTLFDAQTLLMM